MCLNQESPTAIHEEDEIQRRIFNSIDQKQSFIYNAGAGAGKTYSLIKSLEYIIQNKGKALNYHNQKVICITYTNVATNEIRERLGNSELVKVSTIHERLWDLISVFKKQLLNIHIEKLHLELDGLREEFESEDKFQSFRDSENKSGFVDIMLANRDDFYIHRNKRAADFKISIKTFLPEEYDGLLSNVATFKSLVSKIYKVSNYESCLAKIDIKEYVNVKYDARYNNDRLHKMMISHDTLIEYAYKLIEKYNIVKQIVIDKYPFILVDEYQDTDEKVVHILRLFIEYSRNINHNFFVGFFGDAAQNIYDTGVERKIFNIHSDLMHINKNYNRRSVNEIISIINEIRNDDITQESIYIDSNGGSVKFYCGSNEKINDFISHYKSEWGINQENKLHCLVLTNELVAHYNGFGNLYDKLKSTLYYKVNWQNVNIEILSHDLAKLGRVSSLLYRVIEFKDQIENSQTLIANLISESIYRELTFTKLKDLISLLKQIDNRSIKQFLESMFQIYSETDNMSYRKLVEGIVRIDEISIEAFTNYLLNLLYPNIDDSEIDEAKESIENLLELESEEYLNWFQFINKVEEKDVIFHTYHGTKGEEYLNVIIIMQNDFGKEKNKFPKYFKNYANEVELEGDELIKHTNTKNLMYVSCSRAIKNLRVFYLEDISDFKGEVESIFGEVCQF